MSARRLVAFGGFVLAGVILMVLMSSRTGSLIDLDETSVANQPAPEVATSDTAERPSNRPVGDEPVRVSTRIIDFGQVPISYPKRETLYLLNEGGGKLRLVGKGLKAPFSADQSAISLIPNVSTGFQIVSNPSKPGTYEQHLNLVLADANGKGEEVRVLIRGRGVMSPEAAGVKIPERPDAELRAYQAKKRAETIAKAQAEIEERRKQEEELAEQNVDPNGATAGDVASLTGAPANTAAALKSGPQGSSTSSTPRSGAGATTTASYNPMIGSAGIAAFGMGMGDGIDINTVPAALPEGELGPDLPPVDDDGGSGGGNNDDLPDNDSDVPGNDDPGTGDDDNSEPEPGIGLFTIAPNSTVVVYSSSGSMQHQSMPMQVSPEGGNFIIDGRLQFPYLSLAFGQTLTMDQFGPMSGTVTPDGEVSLSLTLRIYDPNGTTLDLPITLTTGMAVGYSASGRVMFQNGYPLKPDGNVKLVAITNIPLGQLSSLDEAPVILEFLGRIQL